MFSKKLERMYKPPSDIKKYDNEEYMKNPLLKFRLTGVKERRHYTFLKQKAAFEKKELCRRKMEANEDMIPQPKSYYIDQLRSHVRKIVVPKMLHTTERKILSFASERLKEKYPKLVEVYLDEVLKEFNRIMKVFSMKKILRNPQFDDEDPDEFNLPRKDFHFKYPGRTSRYSVFLENRRKLGKRLLIVYPFVRAVLATSETEFPETMHDFLATPIQGYSQNKDTPFEAVVLSSYVRTSKLELEKKAYFIRWVWYPKIISIVKRHFRKRTLSTNQWARAYACLEGLINRQINNFKQRTLSRLLDVCGNSRKIPQLKLSLECSEQNDGIEINPTFESIVEAFSSIAKEIASTATKMEPLQPQIDPNLAQYGAEFLRIEMNEFYFEEYLRKLRHQLTQTYRPVKEYVAAFQSKYFCLYSRQMRDDLDEFLSQPRNLTDYFSKIDSYFKYINQLNSEIKWEFFEIAIIHNYPAIEKLKEITEEIISKITQQVVMEHIKLEEATCSTFEDIKRRALEIPKSTEELLGGVDYMIHIRNEKIGQLREEIQYCLHIATDLMSLTEISQYHTELTITTINWLHKITDVFEINASQHEHYKFLFEEHLQEVVSKLNNDIQELLPQLTVINDMSRTEKFRNNYILLQNIIDQLKTFDDYVKWINKEEKLFKIPQTQYPTLNVIKDFVYPFAALIKLCIRWLRHYNVWMDGPFEYLTPNFVEETTDFFLKEFQKTQKYYRVKIKQDLIGDPVCRFKGQTEDPDPEKHPVPLRLCTNMISRIKEFHVGVFIVSIMCNPALRKRHWAEMSEIAEFNITPDAGTTLRKIINCGLESKLSSFEIISISANKELQLQLNLHAMIKEWDTKIFPTAMYKETGVTILSNMDEIQALLDDNILKTLSMRGSAFMKPCAEEVLSWYEKLIRVNKTLEQWGKVQASYLYLLPIFSSKDIVAQMPEEGRLFVSVEQTFKRNMAMVMRQPLVMTTAPAAGILESLDRALEQLEDITNGVNNYLEKKRLYFPRFFFLSNDEMLEILSETKDPLRVLPHLSKCFEGINSLEFDSAKNVLSMFSSDKEQVQFVEMVSTSAAGGSVEKWLSAIEAQMLIAIRHIIECSYSNYLELKRCDWVLQWPQMVVLCVSQIFWAANVQDIFHKSGGNALVMSDFLKNLTADLNDIVALIRSKSISNLNRITIKSLIVIDVHARDIADELLRCNVSNDSDFQWLSQLRYYWENGDALVRIINATVPYAYEYLGNSDRLVITPLTDRCYRTLIGAYQLHLNGAPEGPAGTGKTETTKDLAKALAVQCKVFNCSDGLDYKAMGKFFKGLASCGAWACFDEFNRIELEVLSVVAQQILSIIQAVRAKAVKFVFEGTELSLNPACYVCITMNPGYAGRSELPDNLKVLFRSVAMMVPDYAMIGEISLYSYGFVNARALAVKIVTTYRLCSEQLSTQNHYDYGMRAVKTVLQACGNIKKVFPDELEDILLLRSLLDVNLPKFMSFDIPLFEGIISDLFPGITLPSGDYSLIAEHFKRICLEMYLEPTDSFLTKVIQTYEMMIVRHGFMMVGEPMAGKSKTLQLLAKVLSALKESTGSTEPSELNPYFQNVLMDIINPKAITMNQLYGAFDPISYEWTDGLVSTIFRKFAMDTSLDRKWVIFDGPVDAVWIENMNTVLDDNKKLCLTSGEVITMSNEMSMIFEVMDLAQASPATVSRCGMIYMEASTLGWKTFTLSWLKQCDKRWANESSMDLLLAYFEWIILPCQEFIRKNCRQYVNPGEFSVLRTTFDIFEMLIYEGIEENLEEYERYLPVYYQAALLFAACWGIGGILDTTSREKFDVFLRQLWSGIDTNSVVTNYMEKIEISLPPEGLLIDYVYVFKQKGVWKYWPDLVKKMEIEETSLGVQVPTIDTARYMYLMEMHVKHHKKLLLVGPTGTGKTVYIQNFLINKLDSEKYMSAFMTFTVMMTANQTQDLLMSKLLKLKRGIYGPPKGQLAVVFVDDMSMPVKEIYGAQPPLELLRYYFDHENFYDLKDMSKVFLRDLLIFCACGLPGGSRQDVYARFLCHFNIFSINTFSEETMHRIFVNVLLNGFKRSGHGNDVFLVTQQIVNATQQIYNRVQSELRATPAKSHYIFNLRDISRVVMGCALLKKESLQENKKIFARLWYHEAMRVFYDRLVDESDQLWMFRSLNECIRDNFKEKVEVIFDLYINKEGDSGSPSSSGFTLDTANQMFFGIYLDEDNVPDERRYEEVHTEAFSKLAYEYLEEYNSTKRSKMDITLFTFALQHLNKICRIISIQGGSALLIGVGGSGRQSLTKLAATICQTSIFQPEITKNYGPNDWHDHLKNILKESGGLGKHTVFLMTENQITMELFLQDIDCLLNQGEVPNIFAIDERQEVLEMVRLDAQGGNRNIDISPLQVFSFFVNRCKHKLHIVLCLSPIGDSLRTRIRLYPSLVNCCTIDWFQSWPHEALQMVAKMSLEDINVESETVKQSIVEACQYFHITASRIVSEFREMTGRIIYITNASFLVLIKSFQTLIFKTQKNIMDAKMRYIGGLDTLKSAASAISEMQKELNALQPKLVRLAENSRKMMEEINVETIAASAAAEQVKKDEVVAGFQAEAAQALKAECEKDLAQAIPVLEDAIQALNTLKPADITLVKSMKNPPSIIKLVLAAVCVIKSVPPDRVADPATGKMVNDYWGPSKRILGEMNFLQALKDFDKDNINPDVMKRIRKEFIPHKDFQPKTVAKASSAAEGLCKWIIAMDLYDNVAKVVAPKKAKLQAAEKEYSDTMKILEEKREMAEALEKKVAILNAELERANAEMQRTQDEAEFCQNKLVRAEALIGGLGGEKSRWTEAAEKLQSIYDNLPGDILISCGIIAYLATLTSSYRIQCVADWFEKCTSLSMPCSTVYSIIDTLGSDILIQSWNLNGLPKDIFSTENAIIADSSSRYSLFIDPQGQANKWIRNMERKNRLHVVKFNQTNYMKVIADALESGTPVLIENVLEELEVPLDPILKKNTFVQGKQKYISLGDNIVPVSDNFRLYMMCNLRNPHFFPETFNKVTIINFALTQSALEDQLLSIVVAKERPDLQELRENLTSEAAKNKAALKNAEDMILETLSSSEGDILENEGAIQILDEAKTLSIDIVAKQEESRETELKIETFRQNYKPVAVHSSILYYSITDLPNVDPMYQFSLNWYINLYMTSIENANKSKDLPRRIKFLVEAITQNLYNNVCRSIFEKDKLLFSFILTTRILLDTNQMDISYLLHLLVGADTTKVIEVPNPDPSWISNGMWCNVIRLEELPTLNSFVPSFTKTVKHWQDYYDHTDPETQPLPAPWEQQTSRFEKILILNALRPDKVFLAVRTFIAAEMGPKFVAPPAFDLAKSFQDSTSLTPLIFILTPGADPLGSLVLFAEKMGFEETFQSISLGQGQGPIALKLIKEAQEFGQWVCLQNCHLADSWMPVLEYIWENLDTYNTTPSFRLWLTSYPNKNFPVAMLQNGIKMTNEPPTGLKQNLLRSYNSEPINDDSFYTGCPKQNRAFTRLLYGICFFHAVVQERRNFGPLGWNIHYGFNESDLQISVQQLHMFLNQYDHVPYEAITYLTAECNYGGRVTDTWDRRAIVTILADFVNERAVSDSTYMFANEQRYILTRKSEHREILRYIEENIPSLPPPEVYGLHSNSGITRDLHTTRVLLESTILVIGLMPSTTGAGSSEDRSLVDTIQEINSNMPPTLDVESAKRKYPVDYNESMNTVLVQEIERFTQLQNYIRSSCISLKLAIDGAIVMTPELETVILAITLKKIPAKWMTKSYPSLKPLGSYILDFFNRLNWLKKWYDYGKPPTFWISGFFFTQGFLTGAMQNYARKYKIPIDTLTFDFEVLQTEGLLEPPTDGVYVNGLFIEGARWNIETQILDEQLPKVLLSQIPAIHIKPILIINLVEGSRYKCPLYKTAERKGVLSTTGHSTNYVIPILLNTYLLPTHWIKRSTALICQTSD